MYILFIALLLLCPAGLCEIPGSPDETIQIEAISPVDHGKNGFIVTGEYEGGEAYRTSSDLFLVLNLTGSWREMGHQYGGLAGEELRLFHDRIVADVTDRGVSGDEQIEIAREIYDGFSPELQELLLGMSETSGLTMDEVLILNAGMILLTDAVLADHLPGLPDDGMDGCSGIGVWDQYTEDGSVIFGRNWDVDRASMKEYMEFLSVVVLHPDDGNAYANIHPLGNVYLETGMNSEGLFIELNNGAHSDPTEYSDRQNTASVLVDVLRECRDAGEAVLMLKSIPADLSFILQIADPEGVVSLERGTYDSRVRGPDDEGLVIAVNHFIPPYPPEWNSWVQPARTDADDPRYSGMKSLAQSPDYMGQFTPELMQEYLMVPMESGGGYHNGTVYQIVAVPERKTIWLHACEYADWEEVPLASLFG